MIRFLQLVGQVFLTLLFVAMCVTFAVSMSRADTPVLVLEQPGTRVESIRVKVDNEIATRHMTVITTPYGRTEILSDPTVWNISDVPRIKTRKP